MQKIKVLHVITSLGLGGAEKLLLIYLKKLNPEKYSFFVCSLRDNPDELRNEISVYAEIINLKMRNKFNFLVIYELWKTIKKIHPNIIHTHLFQPRIYTTIAHLFNKHGVLITHKHSVVNPKKHHIFLLVEMLTIYLNKRVIAISESVKKSLRKYELIPEKKIFVLPNCINLEEFYQLSKVKETISQNSITIGTVGRIEDTKGINYLLLAMKQILSRYPNIKLEIIGDGSALKKMKALSKKLEISNSVIFFGKLVNPIPNYRRMNIFILPSILEGFGIVLLEAMAAGIPVIATNVHGIKEVVVDGESGILIPSKNPDAIADAVFRIIENPQLSKKLIEEGLIRSKLFDVPEHLKKLENLYNSLLGAESF